MKQVNKLIASANKLLARLKKTREIENGLVTDLSSTLTELSMQVTSIGQPVRAPAAEAPRPRTSAESSTAQKPSKSSASQKPSKSGVRQKQARALVETAPALGKKKKSS